MFRCNNVCWREDMHLENQDISGSFDMMFKHTIHHGDNGTEDRHGDYTAALYEYSGRNLGYDSDVLNAFGGVLAVIIKRMRNDRHPAYSQLYGLSSVLFDWALLWEPERSIHRRPGGWPSWSWCGWIGRMAMVLTHFRTTAELDNWLQHHTWIKYTLFDNAGHRRMEIPSSDTYKHGASNFPIEAPRELLHPAQALPWLGNETIDRIQQDIATPELVELSPLIHLTAPTINLYLAPSDVCTEHARSHVILDATGRKCGTIWIHDDTSISATASHEFLIMSRAERKSVVGKDEFADASCSGEWDAYHVMLVNRIHEGEICERLALGRIFCETFSTCAGAAAWKGIWLL
jgi:hypothetical protein